MDDSNSLDAMSVIRRNPGMYISTDRRPLALRLLDGLLFDTDCLNVESITVNRKGEWTFVGSNIDWLKLGKWQSDAPTKLFDRTFPFAEAGANAVRHEAVLHALADRILLFGPEGCGFLSPFEQEAVPKQMIEYCRAMNMVRIVGYEVK